MLIIPVVFPLDQAQNRGKEKHCSEETSADPYRQQRSHSDKSAVLSCHQGAESRHCGQRCQHQRLSGAVHHLADFRPPFYPVAMEEMEDEGKLKITSTDLEVSLTTVAGVDMGGLFQTGEKHHTTVPAIKMFEIMRALSHDEVHIETKKPPKRGLIMRLETILSITISVSG